MENGKPEAAQAMEGQDPEVLYHLSLGTKIIRV